MRLGELLCDLGFLEAAELERALETQAQSDPRGQLGAVLLSLDLIDDQKLAQAFARQMGTEVWNLEEAPPDPELKEIIPAALAQSCRIVPQSNENGFLRCVATGPIAASDRAKIEFLANRPVRFVVASESDILHCIQDFYGVSVESMIADLSTADDAEVDEQEVFVHDLREMAQEPTLVNLVNMIIAKAMEERASDIHIEPFESTIIVKYRIDGILQEIPPPPKQFQSAIVSRIKIMAAMDIAERYIPQDGQIRVNLPETKVDIRVSTIPTVFGESVVLRLLNKDEALLDLGQLGLSGDTRRRLVSRLSLPHGILLVCGPTGSGKSTTLYGALKHIFTPEKKIITIEDPVEFQIHGINQIPVRPKRGLTFASGLRSILRQDPDIIMVGEIRDRETADIAIRAALTGHLVLSTLHTNDAPSAVTRLLDMGLEPFLIASSVQGILGQRLVRRLCSSCRRRVVPDPELPSQFDSTKLPEFIYEPVGCEECRGRGFSGRVGIFEFLTIDDQLHDLILRSATSNEVKAAAADKMQTMIQTGWDKVCDGVTSAGEVLKATRFEEAEGA